MRWTLVVFVFAIGVGTAEAAEEQATVAFTLELKTSEGAVYCALFSTADGFPGEPKKAVAQKRVKPKAKRAVCTFEKVAPGSYALSAYHDENDNGELDTNWVGIPSEPIGTSNNAKGSFGPPKFKDAQFTVTAKGFKQSVRLE